MHGDLLLRLGHIDAAKAAFERAAMQARNARERELLLQRAASAGLQAS